MLKRKAYQQIDDWFHNDKRALFVTGARAIGKTTLIKYYLDTNNIAYVSFDLIQDQVVRQIFDTSDNASTILLRLSALTNQPMIPGKTVIFIDEAQAAQDALTVIKYLILDGRYRFIFSGSFLAVKMRDIESIPVGFLHILKMYPMNFEEFMDAIGVNESIKHHLKVAFDHKTQVDDVIHHQMMNLFNTYLVIGGLPAAVQEYVRSANLGQVLTILNDIDHTFHLDISKYDKDSKLLIQDVYDLIPSQLNASNKRFVLKQLNENARFGKYESSLVWLLDSAVGLFVYNVDNPGYPLIASKERTLFKLFLCDNGLLSSKLFNDQIVSILNGDTNVNFGALYEAVVAKELDAHGYSLYYYNNKKRGEVDFLIEQGNKVIPIEVKSGKDYRRHVALDNLLRDYADIPYGYVLTNDNVSVNGKKIYLPIYMLLFIQPKVVELSTYKPDISALVG